MALVITNPNMNQLIRQFSRMLSTSPTVSRSTNPVPTVDDPVLSELVEKYSKYKPTPVSIQHFLEFGRKAGLKSSYEFLQHELPVRLAGIMKELTLLPQELRHTKHCTYVKEQYVTSFSEIIQFEGRSADASPNTIKNFTDVLYNMHARHADTVQIMASAVLEVKRNYTEGPPDLRVTRLPKFERNIQYFLDRLYMSRISTRMLINQHTLLFYDKKNSPKHLVGSIDPECDIVNIVDEAYESAKFICEQYYMAAPEMEITSFDRSKGGKIDEQNTKDTQARITCVYIPSHLYHILFELFKNAMRATIEYVGEEALTYPPIKVHIVKSDEDVTIKLSDQGGGIPRRLKEKVFQYLYTTAPNPTSPHEDPSHASMGGAHGVPLAGYGYGLPLSRLYARYFAGDLEIYSHHGYGTDALIYLQAVSAEAREDLPIFHETGSRKIYEAQLTANDWTIERT